MVSSILQNSFVLNQQDSSKDGEKNMLGKAFRSYLDSVIRENCCYHNGCYSLYAYDIPYEDKKILLSYLVSPEDFEDLTSNATRERVAFADYEDDMQFLIDNRINDLWHEDMQEMGLHACSYQDNGEIFYTR